MRFIVVFLLASLHGAPTASEVPFAGPPLVCHQLEIGTARSLPWKAGPFGMDPELALERVPNDTLAVLAESGDAVVHMETLRRAYIYLQFGRDAERLTALGTLLKDRVLDASTRETQQADGSRASTLAWFDLGYLMAIITNNGGPTLVAGSSSSRVLAHAARLAPRRADVQFGVGYALTGNNHDSGRRHLDLAAELTTDAESLVARNLTEVQRHRWAGESRPNWPTMRKILLGGDDNADADTRPGADVIYCPVGPALDPVPVTLVGTVAQVCEKLVVIRVEESSAADTKPQPVRVGALLDVVSPDRQTYVARIRIIAHSNGVTVGLVNASARDVKSGDLVIAGLN